MGNQNLSITQVWEKLKQVEALEKDKAEIESKIAVMREELKPYVGDILKMMGMAEGSAAGAKNAEAKPEGRKRGIKDAAVKILGAGPLTRDELKAALEKAGFANPNINMLLYAKAYRTYFTQNAERKITLNK